MDTYHLNADLLPYYYLGVNAWAGNSGSMYLFFRAGVVRTEPGFGHQKVFDRGLGLSGIGGANNSVRFPNCILVPAS